MSKILKFGFGTVEVFEQYVVAVMNEGITVKPEYNDELIKVANRYFENTSFGYITHRKNSYAVDPRIYFETSKIENLVAFAVVSEDIKKISSVEVEKIFLKKPFQQFKKLEEAQRWVASMLSEKKV